MVGKISSGQLCTVTPVGERVLELGDIVQIANRGGINWIARRQRSSRRRPRSNLAVRKANDETVRFGLRPNVRIQPHSIQGPALVGCAGTSATCVLARGMPQWCERLARAQDAARFRRALGRDQHDGFTAGE